MARAARDNEGMIFIKFDAPLFNKLLHCITASLMPTVFGAGRGSPASLPPAFVRDEKRTLSQNIPNPPASVQLPCQPGGYSFTVFIEHEMQVFFLRESKNCCKPARARLSLRSAKRDHDAGRVLAGTFRRNVRLRSSRRGGPTLASEKIPRRFYRSQC